MKSYPLLTAIKESSLAAMFNQESVNNQTGVAALTACDYSLTNQFGKIDLKP